MLFIKAVLAVTLTFVCTTILFGQDKAEYKAEHKVNSKAFCSGNHWSSDDKVSFSEVREMTIPATSLLTIDGGKNGGISVKGDNRSDILVRACVNAWGTTDAAARAVASNIRIATSPAVKADNSSDESGWSVSYEVLVPRNTNLKLDAHNGGISIKSVEGALEFETTNGGVSLYDVAGDVRGRTTNGGVNVSLSGNSWKGSGLEVVTTNGGVNLSMPESYAANIETGTTNGGFRSDIASLNVERTEKTRNLRINTAINGGGAPIRVITTNGGVRINSSSKSQ